MVDKCAPHPWARAQSQPPRGEKIKSILLLFTLCDLFAHRHTPDIYTKQTRTSSVIHPPFADQTKMHKTEKQHQDTVFFYSATRGSHPYALFEGHGTTPSEKRRGGGVCRRVSRSRHAAYGLAPAPQRCFQTK
jgi:hypothetical protein